MKLEKTIGHIVIILAIIIWLFPLAVAVMVIIKSPDQYNSMKFWSIPPLIEIARNLRDNLISAIIASNLWGNFVNSILYAVTASSAAAITASMSAYALVFLKIKRRMAWFLSIFGTNFVVIQMFLIPLYQYLKKLGIYDTRFGLFLIYFSMMNVFAILVFRNFSLTLPKDVFDMAKIDGCSKFGTYIRVFIPLCIPVFAVVFVFQFLGTWNDLLFGMILTEENARPLMTALSRLEGVYAGVTVPEKLMGVIFGTIPPLLVLAVFHKYFTKGISLWLGKD